VLTTWLQPRCGIQQTAERLRDASFRLA
jgi:hypothetical protein